MGYLLCLLNFLNNLRWNAKLNPIIEVKKISAQGLKPTLDFGTDVSFRALMNV